MGVTRWGALGRSMVGHIVDVTGGLRACFAGAVFCCQGSLGVPYLLGGSGCLLARET